MMKSTGIVRRIDDLGRVVLPIELRRTLGISDRDSLEIYVDQTNIILKKYEAACVFCGGSNSVRSFKDRVICEECITNIGQSK